MTLNRNVHQGYYGEAFVRALATAAGLIVGQDDIDVCGIDVKISFPGNRGTARYPMIEGQVKSWAQAPDCNGDAWRYSLPVKNFNDLAGDGFYLPRYLFLVIVPPQNSSYTLADGQSLRLHHAGYWASFSDREPLPLGSQASITVSVPKQNLLTVDALRSLLEPAPLRRRAS